MAHELRLAEIVALLIALVQSLQVTGTVAVLQVMRLLAGVVVRLVNHRHRTCRPIDLLKGHILLV